MLTDCDRIAQDLWFGLPNHLWWQNLSHRRLLTSLVFSPSPQQLGESQNISCFGERYIGCLERNLITFSTVACCRMERASGFSCFVYCFVTDEQPNTITVVKLSNVFFIGIHVALPMQAFITFPRMNLA